MFCCNLSKIMPLPTANSDIIRFITMKAADNQYKDIFFFFFFKDNSALVFACACWSALPSAPLPSNPGWSTDLAIHYLAAKYKSPAIAIATTRALRLFKNQSTIFRVVESNHDTTLSIQLHQARQRLPFQPYMQLAYHDYAIVCLFQLVFDSTLWSRRYDDCFSWNNSSHPNTPMIKPTMVMPFSLISALNFSPRVVSSFKTLFIVSFILFFCELLLYLHCCSRSDTSIIF